MEVVRKSLVIDTNIFSLIAIGDIHAGTVCCDLEKLDMTIEKARKLNHEWRAIGMGDYCEFINFRDPRFDPESFPEDQPIRTLSNLPKYQAGIVYEHLSPLNGKWLGLITGNHEDTIRIKQQHDIIKDLCELTGAEFLGFTCQMLLELKAPVGVWSIPLYIEHGTGYTATAGTALNKIMSKRASFDAMIYLMGHLHHSIGEVVPRLDLGLKGQQAHQIERMQVCAVTGSYLRTYKKGARSYGEGKYPPVALGNRFVTIDLENRKLSEGSFFI